MTQVVTYTPTNTFNIQPEIEDFLRLRVRNRNEKYYQILLSSWTRLTGESYKAELTADAIIKNSDIARPTWYGYFKSVKHYYADVLEVMGKVMIEYSLVQLRENATYDNWTTTARKLRLLVFLSNSKNIVAYFPELSELWFSYYSEVIDSYADILGPILKLSPGRAKLFVKNIANEMIVHKEKYFGNTYRFDRFVNREYALFLAEQNS